MRNMDKKVPGVVVEELSTGKPSGLYKNIIWCLLLCGLLSSVSLYVMMAENGGNGAGMLHIVLQAAVTLLCCGLSKKQMALRYWQVICNVVPWGLMLILSQFHGYWDGAKSWMNVIIYRWNEIHDGGVLLFQTNGGSREEMAFLLLLTVLLVQICWWIIQKRKLCVAVLFGLAWIFLALISEVFHPVIGAALFCAFLGMRLSDQKMNTVHRKLFWFAVGITLAAVGEIMIPDQDMQSVTQFREQVKSDVHTWRYGEDSLPEGDLRQADILHASDAEMLRVQSEQIKNMYFRGFVGGKYNDGQWTQMPDSAYGGENAGILDWLSEHGFDPMTQTSDYYKLCTGENIPDVNNFRVQVSGAARCYMYMPVTMQKLSGSRTDSDGDSRITGRGLHGQKNYQGTEISSVRPAELTVAEDWINAPQTEAQKQYCEAEAVYRKFVYQTYTQTEPELADTLQELFWDSYDAENDGIYSAVNQVRNVLRDTVQYTEHPQAAPEGQDPVLWFLQEARTGNAVQYASTAVEALRLHGIPARYVEGYYLRAAGVEGTDQVATTLSGQDAHAWVEVYFDGIGWLPVDVTPGYYYDTISLQQMISLPEQTQNSASWDQSAYKAAELQDTQQRHKKHPEAKTIIKHTVLFILGVAGCLFIILTVALIAFELIRIIRIWKIKKRLREASGQQRIFYKQKILYQILKVWDIDASLGWYTTETDQLIAEQFTDVEAGEYTRICRLLEKVIYGEQDLEVFEERVIDYFLQKLLAADASTGWRQRMKLRYQLMQGVTSQI